MTLEELVKQSRTLFIYGNKSMLWVEPEQKWAIKDYAFNPPQFTYHDTIDEAIKVLTAEA